MASHATAIQILRDTADNYREQLKDAREELARARAVETARARAIENMQRGIDDIDAAADHLEQLEGTPAPVSEPCS